jgi:acyl-CoA synthetase (AMP-forming)/AMP-acid ligase II
MCVFWQVVVQQARHTPQRVALVCVEEETFALYEISYADVVERVDALTKELKEAEAS